MKLPCRARVNYRGYAVAVHRRLCYPHVAAAAVYNKYIRGPGLLDERAEDLPPPGSNGRESMTGERQCHLKD